MNLRYYQQEAIDSIAEYIKDCTGNPCVEIPTGGGKTPIIASLVKELAHEGYRTLIVAHRKELLQQTIDKLKSWANGVSFGVISAGLNRREFTGDCVVAGIQSVYKDAMKITAHGKIDFLIIDEAHLIPPSHERDGGRYNVLINDLKISNPNLTIIGFTATPFRLGSGYVCGEENILNKICYSVNVNELISKGYLSPLINKAPGLDVDFNRIKIENGEFKKSEVEAKLNVEDRVRRAVKEILNFADDRNKVLVFCCSVAHAAAVAAEIKRQSSDVVEVVTGETNAKDRERIIANFSGQVTQSNLIENDAQIKYLVNVDVLTTGFDAPNVDCVVLLRPTQSPGLYCQMVGRGLRLSPNKTDCLILDYGGNIERHGPIDNIQVIEKKNRTIDRAARICPACFTALATNATICECCGHKFIDDRKIYCVYCGHTTAACSVTCEFCGETLPIRATHETNADVRNGVLSVYNSEKKQDEYAEKVMKESFLLHSKNGKPPCVWVMYRTESGVKISEFLCFSHSGFARLKAEQWWVRRTTSPCPESTEEALDLINDGATAATESVIYRPAAVTPKKLNYPELIKSIPAEKVTTYERGSSNPCGFICNSCGNDSFFNYLKVVTEFGKKYKVVCKSCDNIFLELNEEAFEIQKSAIESLGIIFREVNF